MADAAALEAALGGLAQVAGVLAGARGGREAREALGAVALRAVEVVADRSDQRVRLARQAGEGAADGEVGLARAVDVGRDDRVDAGVRPQQADETVVVERLAEVHVAAAAPRAECGVTGGAHRPAVCQLLAAAAPAPGVTRAGPTRSRRRRTRSSRPRDRSRRTRARSRAPAWRRDGACTSPAGGWPRCRARTRRPASRASSCRRSRARDATRRATRCTAARSSRSTTAASTPEPDQQLGAVGQQAVDHEIAERVARRDRVDAAALALDPQPELDASRRLAERDGLALGGRQRRRSDVRQHVERDRQHARARPQDIAVARAHLDAVADRPERIHRRGEPLRERRLRSHRVDQAARLRAERVDPPASSASSRLCPRARAGAGR